MPDYSDDKDKDEGLYISSTGPPNNLDDRDKDKDEGLYISSTGWPNNLDDKGHRDGNSVDYYKDQFDYDNFFCS